MSLPTPQEKYAELIEHLRLACEAAYTLGHLRRDESPVVAQGWLAVGQMLENTVTAVTGLATKGRLN